VFCAATWKSGHVKRTVRYVRGSDIVVHIAQAWGGLELTTNV
jgi:hypothetical protein